ncbi:MAG: hypothetical protein ACU84Q_14290 [Gammaproteobacteria bacterium]
MERQSSIAILAGLIVLLTACHGIRPKDQLPPPADPAAPDVVA